MTRAISVVSLLCAMLVGCAEPKTEPNLLLITLDTTRSDHFGFAGHQAARTPNFDTFAAERAVTFENAISSAPVTFPSHSTILTGTYPVFHGVHNNDGYALDDDVTTLAEILKQEGFTTGAVVAAFPLDSEVNLDQGFDSYDDDYQADWAEAEIAARGPFSFGFLERTADQVNKAVERWLEKNSQQRFFLWVHYFDPHQPYDPPPPYNSQFAADPYDGEIAFMDENFGSLLEMFEARGLLENTIIAVVGDHGESLGDHGEPTHAHFIYDSTIRVPLLFAAPGDRFPPGTKVSSQVRTVDVAPTVLDLLGLQAGPEMQGESLLPLLKDPDLEWSSEALLENYYNMLHYDWAPLRGLRTDNYDFIESPTPELYNLLEDPGALINLAASNEEQVSLMRDRMQQLVDRFSSPDLGRSAAAQIDDETRQKLEALGYLAGDSTVSERAAPFPSLAELATLKDPKDNTPLLKYINFVSEIMRAQRFDDAVPVINNALAIDPSNPKLLLQRAEVLAALGRWDKAMESAKQSQAIKPEDARAFAIIATIHVGKGEYEEAVTPLTRAIELYPQNVSLIQRLAGIYLKLDRIEEAIPHLEAVITLDESHWQAMADLANAYYLANRWDEAREMLQRALQIRPYSSTVRYRIAVFYRDTGNLEFSRRMFEETLRLAPDHLSATLDLGELLVSGGDIEGARPYLERVIELAPQSTRAKRANELLEGTASN